LITPFNCYRGCITAARIAFSRPTHEYLGYGAGTDFDRKIVAKVNAPELLRKDLMRRRGRRRDRFSRSLPIRTFQLEAEYKLTRRCLEVCAGVSVMPVRRDHEVGVESAAEHRRATGSRAQLRVSAVFFTIPFTDVETARAVEPLRATSGKRDFTRWKHSLRLESKSESESRPSFPVYRRIFPYC
jgi:hypothetical protein